MLSEFLKNIYGAIKSLTLETSLYICWGAFAFVFLLTLFLTLFQSGVRRADKRPYLCMVNAFTAVTFALAYIYEDLSFSLILAAVFWCIGYLSYGAVCLASRRKRARAESFPVSDLPPRLEGLKCSVSPAKTNVRTEHALSVTEKLLEKDLGRGDRQETERIKSALDFMKMKGDLTPADNERLNDNFNALLKLMAKYGL